MHYGYYDQFFRFSNLSATWVIALFVTAVYPPLALTALLLPFVLIYVGYHSAYLLHYNLFARIYATALEERINGMIGEEILVAHKMEDVYFYPTPGPKFVTWAWSRGVTFIGFATINFFILGGLGFAMSWYRAWQLTTLYADRFLPLHFYHPALILWAGINFIYLAAFFIGGKPERTIDRIVRDAYRLD